jgi:hypothetical protein
MTTRLLILLAAVLLCWAAPAQGQTIKTLGFNTNNGNVIMPSSITFSNNVNFGQSIFATTNGVSAGGTLFAGSGSTISFYAAEDASRWRTNLSLGLPALTNTSNVTAMRALAGSTNTNEPFSGSISVVGTNNTNTLVFSNGILLSQ